MNEEQNFEPISADKFVAAIKNEIATEEALKAVKQRSYAGRHPELGKMVKCQICKTRHRAVKQCSQKFHKLEDVEQIAGQTHYTAPDITVEAEIGRKKIRIALGAANFNGKRKNPHLNRRKSQFVNLVHQMLEDGYSQEELQLARKYATAILVKRWGRYHFMESLAEKAKRVRLAKESQ